MAFENLVIAGKRVSALSVAGKPVASLWVNGKKLPDAARGITLQALKALGDSDLTLTTNLSGETVDFDMTCYDQSGSKLGTVTVTGDVYPSVSLLDKMEEAGISRDAMKLAGSRTELAFRKWSYYSYVDDPEYSSGLPWKLDKKVLFGIRSQTAGALQVYGDVMKSFRKCTTGICLAYMF